MTREECAAELDALLVWWMLERRTVAGGPALRVTVGVSGGDRVPVSAVGAVELVSC